METNTKYILSPCGTSSLTNGTAASLRSLIFKYANAQTEKEIPPDDLQALSAHIHTRQQELLDASVEEASKCSAELNALIKLYSGEVHVAKGRAPDLHCLLCTDTWLGKMVGENIKAWLEAHGQTVLVKNDIKGLRTDDLDGFQTAMADLARWCADELTDYKNSGYKIIFNLTGGFKSIQGFLQTLAMFYADESVYIFETGSDLLRLPRLPVMLGEEAHVREHLAVFRKLFLYGKLPKDECRQIAETLLFQVDDDACLSAWGELVWSNAKSSIYRDQVLPSPSEQIVYGDSFLKSTKGLPPERMAILNERIDDLARYLHSQRQQPLRRLDFKALTGNPRPPATHEIDAWADADTKRVFIQDQGERVILLALDKALH